MNRKTIAQISSSSSLARDWDEANVKKKNEKKMICFKATAVVACLRVQMDPIFGYRGESRLMMGPCFVIK